MYVCVFEQYLKNNSHSNLKNAGSDFSLVLVYTTFVHE